MSRKTLVFLFASLIVSLVFFSLARWVCAEGKKREAVCRQAEASRDFLRRHSQKIEAARRRLAQWAEDAAGPVEARLVDAVSRFQRRRDDFRLVGLSRAPEGILMEAECRSQAAVEFLFFCERELSDLAFARISLGCPPGTRVGSLRTEFVFRVLAHPPSFPLPRSTSTASTSPFSFLSPRPFEVGLRQ
ncbi:hypothetical protein MAMC_02049 [Methylacidimicrobium cyclopophantes]|uniref:Uncharacterized protein n=1 Tax=Methylacidimicrobium cyclopophantes TaxID=1041766 RepID=A0A5E6MH24_9BACT|nr:hypothetical protein [Methylacidimicrobium cyclopophantes]VVM08313.1 hypothetical protein MAMC_02049 [Methylacidimicrobium cyclopophantes]